MRAPIELLPVAARSSARRGWLGKLSSAVASAALALSLSAVMPNDAKALTVSLNFVTSTTGDIFGVNTSAANLVTSLGFTTMNAAQVQSSILTSLLNDYLGYAANDTNALSPLAAGKRLDIDFVIGSGAPANGDAENYFVNIGNDVGSNGFLGAACYGCVRDSSGTGPHGVSNHETVGSILVDNIASLASLAANDAERINLLEGTIAHEIGHTLFLDHPFGTTANPGASAYSLMGTGASPTNMPNAERVKDRAFSYAEFSQLIQSVGVRDVSTTTAVPEPGTLGLVGLAMVALAAKSRRGVRAAASAC
jgi:hypothetical protein